MPTVCIHTSSMHNSNWNSIGALIESPHRSAVGRNNRNRPSLCVVGPAALQSNQLKRIKPPETFYCAESAHFCVVLPGCLGCLGPLVDEACICAAMPSCSAAELALSQATQCKLQRPSSAMCAWCIYNRLTIQRENRTEQGCAPGL